jgi:hypothetical protein
MKIAASGLLMAAAAWGQCSMCRTAAAAQGAAAGKTLDHAVLILLVPAVTLFAGVFLAAFRIGSSHDEPRDRG